MKLKDARISTVDFETTGLDPTTDKICEVGWCDLVLNREGEWDSGAASSFVVNPRIPIPAVASAVHHLTDRDVKGAPTLENTAIGRIFAKENHGSKRDLFVAHNAEFDRAFAGEYGAGFPWLCSMRLAKHLLPDAPSFGNQVLRYHLGFVDVPGEAHNAGHDAKVTAMVLCHMLNHLQEAHTVETIVTFAEQPVFLTGNMGFGKHARKTWQKVGQIDRGYLQWMKRQGPESKDNPDGWSRDQWFTLNKILSGGPL